MSATRESPNRKPRMATVDNCFDLIGSCQCGAAARNRPTSFGTNCQLYCVSFEVITMCICRQSVPKPVVPFFRCYTVFTRSNQVETVSNSCSSWLSVWIVTRQEEKEKQTTLERVVQGGSLARFTNLKNRGSRFTD